MSLRSLELPVEGMRCEGCVQRLRRVLERVPGLRVEEVVLGRARVALDGASPEEVEAAVRRAGLEVRR